MSDLRLCPLVGYTMHRIADSALVLGLQTVSSDDRLRAVLAGSATPDILHTVMTPAQCLDLAEALSRHARAILDQPTPPRSGQS